MFKKARILERTIALLMVFVMFFGLMMDSGKAELPIVVTAAADVVNDELCGYEEKLDSLDELNGLLKLNEEDVLNDLDESEDSTVVQSEVESDAIDLEDENDGELGEYSSLEEPVILDEFDDNDGTDTPDEEEDHEELGELVDANETDKSEVTNGECDEEETDVSDVLDELSTEKDVSADENEGFNDSEAGIEFDPVDDEEVIGEDQFDGENNDATLEGVTQEEDDEIQYSENTDVLSEEEISDEQEGSGEEAVEEFSIMGSPVMLMSTTEVSLQMTEISVNELSELKSAITAANDGDVITLASEFTGDITGLVISNGKAFTLDLGGNTLSSANSDDYPYYRAFISIIGESSVTLTGGTIKRGVGHEDHLINVSYGELTLRDITLDGNSDLGLTGHSLIYANGSKDTKAVVNITDGTEIINNNSSGHSGGAGVFISSNAVLNMDGGEISGNQAGDSSLGGGILLHHSSSEATITGGKITENTGLGGGISSSGTLTIRDSEISGNIGGGISSSGTLLLVDSNVKNNVSSGDGGGISGGGSMTIEGGEISGNIARDGGGISSRGTLLLSDVVINNNKANSSGGGVSVSHSGSVTMHGGEVSNNETSGAGGGFSGSGDITILSGKIINNTARSGGGISSRGTLVIEGGEISGNTADYGGGIEARNMFLMSGGNISENKAANWGGGIAVSPYGSNAGSTIEATVIIQGGTISGNEVTGGGGEGGGISLSKDSWLGITGGEISGNKAYRGAGIHSEGSISITGGKISGNTTSRGGSGGGISSDSLLGGGIINITGGEISENTAQYGGGIHTVGGTLTIENGIISGNEAIQGAGIYAFSSLTGFVGKDWPLPVTLTVKGGVISNNHATGDFGVGGGIYIMENETVKGSYSIEGGEISGNTAWSGGGIHTLYFDNLTISGGTIKENKATNGGGISAFGGNLIVSGGTITGNEATETGGGIRIYSNTETSIIGGEIKNNIAGKAGDDIASPVYDFTLQSFEGWYWDNEDARAREGAGEALTEIPTGGSVYLAFEPSVSIPTPIPTLQPVPTPTSTPIIPTNHISTMETMNILDAPHSSIHAIGDSNTGETKLIPLDFQQEAGLTGFLAQLKSAGVDDKIIQECSVLLLNCENETIRDLVLLAFYEGSIQIESHSGKTHCAAGEEITVWLNDGKFDIFNPVKKKVSSADIFHEIGHAIDALIAKKNGLDKGTFYSGVDERYWMIYKDVKDNVTTTVGFKLEEYSDKLRLGIGKTEEYTNYIVNKVMNEKVPNSKDVDDNFTLWEKAVLNFIYDEVRSQYKKANELVVDSEYKKAYGFVVSDVYSGITNNNILYKDGLHHKEPNDYWYTETGEPKKDTVAEIWAEYVAAVISNSPDLESTILDSIMQRFYPSYNVKKLAEDMLKSFK